MIADCDGMLEIDTRRLNIINGLGEMMVATRHSGFTVHTGDKLAGMRVIPLVIEKAKMEAAKKAVAGKPLMNIRPFKVKRVGLVTTGNEVFYGRIEDTFSPVIYDKVKEFGARVEMHTVLPDNPDGITAAIKDMLTAGMETVFCTGGMSVDPDDRTPLAIKNTGNRIVSYGAPVLPGAMFLLSYTTDARPVVGLPGCVMYAKRTIFDLALPYLMSGTELDAVTLARMGEGGLCLDCPVCTFPNCGFGK